MHPRPRQPANPATLVIGRSEVCVGAIPLEMATMCNATFHRFTLSKNSSSIGFSLQNARYCRNISTKKEVWAPFDAIVYGQHAMRSATSPALSEIKKNSQHPAPAAAATAPGNIARLLLSALPVSRRRR